jgi:hypothetical protein
VGTIQVLLFNPEVSRFSLDITALIKEYTFSRILLSLLLTTHQSLLTALVLFFVLICLCFGL